MGLLLLCLTCAGCDAPGFVTYVIAGPPKVDAVFDLDERATLVIVDDPNNLMGDPNNPAVIAANVGFHLRENEVIEPELIVSQDRLTVLAGQMGKRYFATPIDEIGRRLDAEQVIHVQVRGMDLQSDNTYYEPTADVEVKVIDVVTGDRLFPPIEPDLPRRETQPGHEMLISLKAQTIDETRRHALQMLTRTLAERVGLEVAQLFYKHVPPDAEELGG
jgi:hypothetical protein